MNVSLSLSDLYPRMLGETWWELAEPVRRGHAMGKDRYGSFRVSHGAGWLARWLLRWSGLPRATTAVNTRLRIVSEGAAQRWERDFGGQPFITRQWADADGCLVERFGRWELIFDLRVEDEALCYVQRGARLCLGRFRLPWPRAFAPRVSARETGVGSEKVLVAVTVTLPMVDLLIAYDGHLNVGGAEP